jgi:hypothetical protein
MGKLTPANKRVSMPSLSFWATLEGVAPNTSLNNKTSAVLSLAMAALAKIKLSSGLAWGAMSNARTPEAHSGKTCKAHSRKAEASGAWATMRIPIMLNYRGLPNENKRTTRSQTHQRQKKPTERPGQVTNQAI